MRGKDSEALRAALYLEVTGLQFFAHHLKIWNEWKNLIGEKKSRTIKNKSMQV